jgi:hypothetical protein
MTAVIVPNATSAGPDRARARGRGAVAVAAALCAVAAGARAAEPAHVERFPLVNRAPFTAILGVPSAGGAPGVELSWDIASHAMAERSGAETILLDGETHVLTLRWRGAVGERLALAVELPWVTHGGGFLDGVIDDWHDFFGLSEGIRPELPTGDLRYVYTRGGVEVFRLDDTTSGIGDLRTSAALRLAGAARGAPGWGVDLTADVEWGIGEAAKLTGSGGTDVAAGLRVEAPHGPGGRLGWTAGAGVTFPGDTDLPLPGPEDAILHYDAALAWAARPSLDLVLQVQGQGGGWRSGLDMLGGASLQLGGGFAWRIGPALVLRFGVFEDIRTDTAPDFATELALAWRPGG